MLGQNWNEIIRLRQRRHALVVQAGNMMLRSFQSERMFKTRLQQWGFLKKMRDIDWQTVAVLHKQRQKLGRKTFAYKVHSRKIKLADLRKYLKDRQISEEDLLAEAAANDITGQNIPDYICCFTPTVSSDPA